MRKPLHVFPSGPRAHKFWLPRLLTPSGPQCRLQQEDARRRAQEAAAFAAPAAAASPVHPLPFELPAMPADWKPGDPIPGLPVTPAAAAAEDVGSAVPATDTAVAAATKARELPAQPLLDLDTGIDDDFVLNTEAVASDSDDGDYSSGSGGGTASMAASDRSD
jgi:hypothetical protein